MPEKILLYNYNINRMNKEVIMKVSGIDTIRIEEFSNLLFVEIKTDDGLVGLGETFYGPASAAA